MRSVIFAALVFVLASCTLTTSGQLTDAERAQMSPVQHVYAARQDYNRMLRQFRDYAVQPPCSGTVIVACSDDTIVKVAASYLVQADNALDQAEAIVRSGGATPDALLSNARGALTTLSAYLVAKGIAK